MTKKRIWLSSPHMGGNEQKYIQEAFNTNWIAPAGANLTFFEKNIEDYLGIGFVTALNSGTAAIHLGLLLLGVKSGDEVLCQTLTFAASANPIVYIGAIPVFIDSEWDTWNICPLVLEKAILDRIAKGKKPKAIVAIHLYGIPYKIDEIRIIANKYSIPILEDSAEALGSSYKGSKCGTFGDISVLSFNGSKIITTSGGGTLITKTRKLKERALFLATQAKEKTLHYQHKEIGYNYRMSNVCAGIGRGQMEVLEQRILKRRRLHEFYKTIFGSIEGTVLNEVYNQEFYSNYWLSAVLIDPIKTNGIDSEKLRLAFEKENIESRPLWKPMHLQPVFNKYPYYGGEVAETLFTKGLCLPSGSNMTDEDCQRIKIVIQQLFQQE